LRVLKPSIFSAVLADRVDLVGNQTVRLSVDGVGILCTTGLDQTENLPGFLVDPIAEITHPVSTLGLEVLLMCPGYIVGRYAALDGVYV
jgi:hypothetical protein